MEFTFEGRSTGKGAYTSVGGRRFAMSKSGNHWREVVDAEVGDIITVIDISNTGKHHCHRYEVAGENLLNVVEFAQPHDLCPICEGKP